jgi:hypothetical protein
MSFTVEMADADHHVIKYVVEPADNSTANLPPDRRLGYELLPYIDLYGMTMFNRHQLDKFLEEWRRLAAEGKGNARFFLDVEDLALACQAEPHLYLWFIGD